MMMMKWSRGEDYDEKIVMMMRWWGLGDDKEEIGMVMMMRRR